MKIALLGYGKMGKAIEKIASERGHAIVLRVSKANAASVTDEELSRADVAIEFSTPSTVVENILRCFRANVPVVIGTTAWSDSMEYVAEKRAEHNGSIFHASNFSIGVNLFFRVNRKLAQLMNGYPGYDVRMEEIHHVHKLDSPSGTAITIADGILSEIGRKTKWKDYTGKIPAEIPPNELPIHSVREGEVPGTHSVIYTSPVDRITITHEAFSRGGFAAGAVVAAEWLQGKRGIFGMEDMLGE